MRSKFALLLLCLCAIPTYAQFKASLQGTVLDGRGGVVAGAKVRILEQSTGLSRDTVASDEGFYRLPELPPGRYTVTAEFTVFNASAAKVVLKKAGEPRGLDITLEAATMREQVPAAAPAKAWDPEKTNTGTIIETRRISRPLTSRRMS